jgi:diaminopimelate decarboxylase
MLKFVIPKGSLEEQTLLLLERADLRVRRGSSRDYHGRIEDDRIDRVSLLRPQEIPKLVEDGFFDLGITGRDWVVETGAEVEVLARLEYAKSGAGVVRIVLAVPQQHPADKGAEMPAGSRISTEYPNITRRHFEELGIPVKVLTSYGATEAKVPDIVDAIVDVTETGSTLRAHGMKIIDTLLESEVLLIASAEAAADPLKRRAMDDITTLVLGALRAEGRVLIKLNVSAAGHEVPDRVAARRRGGVRDRDGGREGLREHADPAAEGARRERHPRAPDLQDRPVNAGGLGELARLFPVNSKIDGGRLSIGGCDALELAERFGTPLFVYDEAGLRAECSSFAEAIAAGPAGSRGLFAVKSFPSVAMARLAHEAGLGILCSTAGEHAVATAAGVPPKAIVLHGNNKSEDELRLPVGRLVVDSFDEIDRIERLGVEADAWVRVTPGLAAGAHEFIQTGGVDSKFGIPLNQVPDAARRLAKLPGVRVRGLHAHIGSQVSSDQERRVEDVMLPVLQEVSEAVGEPLRELDLGGGMAVPYTREDPEAVSPADVARLLLSDWPTELALTLEPGRSLVARAGVTLHTIGTVKQIEGVRTYVAVDGGMSDNIRPSLYGARYEFILAGRADAPHDAPVRIVGKHCESGDVLAMEAELPTDVAPGDVLATADTGAYGFALASNYNVVPRPAVVFCRDGEARVVIRRETLDDLLRLHRT